MASKSVLRLYPGTWKSAAEKMKDGIWPWTEGIRGRFPLHYKKRVVQAHMQEPLPVHYKPDERKYTVDRFGQRQRVQNVPIPIKYPIESNKGLWGGIGIIEGLKKKNNDPLKPRIAYIWRPLLLKRVLYSEILDKHMEIVVTKRTLQMIDDAYGFDFYILKTHEVDLKSELGMRLKREMLLALATKSLLPGNPDKRDEVYDRYKQFVIPAEEAEWVGLSLKEAEEKQTFLDAQAADQQRRPLKHQLLDDLVTKLKTTGIEEDESKTSWMSKFSPWQKEAK